MTHQILLAGFGGQGILFSGKFLAYDGLIEDRQVSWLPSYGPGNERRYLQLLRYPQRYSDRLTHRFKSRYPHCNEPSLT